MLGIGASSCSELQMIIRQVMTPRSKHLDISCLPWVTCCAPDKVTGHVVGFEVFRGQSSNMAVKLGIPRVGKNPFEIQILPDRPLSTSKELNSHILNFAASPGRMFMINVVPGIDYVSIRDAIKKQTIVEEDFTFLYDELPEGHAYKARSPEELRRGFFQLVYKENEVLLKPSSGVFSAEDGPETWDRKEAFRSIRVTKSNGTPLDIEVYETGFFPQKGRGRTFRTKPKRRNKNGRRFTHKSSHDDGRNRHPRHSRHSNH